MMDAGQHRLARPVQNRLGAVMSTSHGAGTPAGAGGTGGDGYGRPSDGWGPPPPPQGPPQGPPPGTATIPPSASMPPPMPPYPPTTPSYAYGYGSVPPKRHRLRTLLAVLVLVLAALGAGVGLGRTVWKPGSAESAGSASPTVPNSPSQPQFGGGTNSGGSTGGGSSGSAAGVAAKVDPELVDINTTLGYQDIQAAGTGIVLTSNGEVLTNNHVIGGATAITATDIGNGHTYTATVVGYDRNGDMAILQLKDASGLATAKLGDSSKLAVGTAVTAIGNAGGTGLTPTAAAGSVTGLDQSVTASDEVTGSAEQLTGMIQVNADVQPGDSGGPLVDAAGEVVGMDTAGSQSAGVQQQAAQGFAIPINTALPVAQQIEAGTSSSTVHVGPTAFLGVEVSATSSGTGGSGSGSGTGGGSGGGFGSGTGSGSGSDSGTTAGAPVAGVIPGSPAAQAGLAQGDEITSVGGRSVASADALTTLMATHKPGDRVAVVWTDTAGAQHSATVDLVSGPAN